MNISANCLSVIHRRRLINILFTLINFFPQYIKKHASFFFSHNRYVGGFFHYILYVFKSVVTKMFVLRANKI